MAAYVPPERIDVTAITRRPILSFPGQFLSTAFSIRQDFAEPRVVHPELVLPPGWRSVMKMEPFEIRAGVTVTRLVLVRIPESAEAGSYMVEFRVYDEESPQSVDSDRIEVIVAPVRRLELSVVDEPATVSAGDSYSASMVIVNKGNAPEEVDLNARSNFELPTKTRPARVQLAPGESQHVMIDARAPANITEKTRHRLDVTARRPDESVFATRAASRVDVIPNGRSNRIADNRLPASISVLGVGDERGWGAQAGLTAAGPYLGGNLEVGVELPDRQRTSTFGRRSRFSLRYEKSGQQVAVGDHVYALSPLTEIGRYGFGGGGNVQAGRFTITSFAHRTRQTFPRENEVALGAEYDVHKWANVSVNFLGRRGFIDGELISVRGLVEPSDAAAVDLECGVDEDNRLRRPACSVRVVGRQPWISYQGRYINTPAGFPGYASGLESASVGTIVRPRPWLRVEAAWNEHDQVLAGDFVRKRRVVQAGTGVTGLEIAPRAFAFVYVRHHSVDHSGLGIVNDRREQSVRLRSGFNSRHGGVTTIVEFGHTKSEAMRYSGSFRRAKIQAKYLPARIGTFSGSIEYLSGLIGYTAESSSRWLTTLSARLKISPHTHASLAIHSGIERGYAAFSYSHTQTRIEHEFRNGHRLTVQARYGSFGSLFGSGFVDYLVGYTVPIGLPLPSRGKRRSPAGRVVDVESGEGLEGVRLYIGDQTVRTGHDGTFYLEAPRSHTPYLSIDRGDIGLDHVPVDNMPMEISILDGVLQNPVIGVVRSARISGRIAIHARSEHALFGVDSPPTPVRGIRMAILEIDNGARRHRVLSGVDGNFSFADLSPGTWTIRVVDAQLPEHHYPEQEHIEVDLLPGSDEHIEFRVLEKQRKLRIMETGTLKLGSP